jgi:hypothetical protein
LGADPLGHSPVEQDASCLDLLVREAHVGGLFESRIRVNGSILKQCLRQISNHKISFLAPPSKEKERGHRKIPGGDLPSGLSGQAGFKRLTRYRSPNLFSLSVNFHVLYCPPPEANSYHQPRDKETPVGERFEVQRIGETS